jgi:hypothetical protein
MRGALGFTVPHVVAAGGFVPTDIAGCHFWIDPSDTTSITESGGLVSQINDLSGNSRHLTQGTGSLQPTTGTRTINSLNVLDFIPNDSLVAGSNWTSALTAATVFIVADSDDAGGNHPLWTIGGGNDSWYMFGGQTYEWFGTSVRKNWTPTASIGSPRLHSVVAAANDWRAYQDTTLEFTTGTNTVSFTQTPTLGLSPGGAFDGTIAEVVLYDSALGTTDRETVRDYLITKWGL